MQLSTELQAERRRLIELMAEAERLGDTDLALRIARRFWKLRLAERDRHLAQEGVDRNAKLQRDLPCGL